MSKSRFAPLRIGFWPAQLIMLCCLLTTWWLASRYPAEQPQVAVEPRLHPIALAPQYDVPQVISDEQLVEVLDILKPRLRGQRPKINHVDHAMRFWGLDARFDDPECLTGREMRQLLTDHNTFVARWGHRESPFLVPTRDGVAVRTREGLATASHVDHTMAGLAEIGTPANYELVTVAGTRTMADLLSDSLASFELNQVEYEWSILAYMLYFPHVKQFVTRDGQRVTYDMLAERLMREPLPRGVCFGNHRLYTLTIMLRVDEEHQLLSKSTRQAVLKYLLDLTVRLQQTQTVDGYWNGDWAQAGFHLPQDPDQADAMTSRIMATGHALEWWAMAPRELHPPRENLVRAGQWLYHTISSLGPERVREYYTFLTHAGRALTLWRGTTPDQLTNNGWLARQSQRPIKRQNHYHPHGLPASTAAWTPSQP